MITFMQKHKKYLVITIWVSVIAFIGAGFVGWGSVDLNIMRSTGVASVGKLNVSQQEFNRRYSSIFNYYNQFQNGSLDQEMAKAMGLDQEALRALIQEKLLLNYANDLGLYVSDTDIAMRIKQDSSFYKDGSFDRDTYLRVLKQIGFSASEYEKQIKNSLMLEKVLALFEIKSTQEELQMLSSSIFMQDLVGLKTLSIDVPSFDDDELMKFWEQTKDDYQTTATNEISLYIEPLAANEYQDSQIQEYYEQNKFDFVNEKEEILSLDEAKEQIIKALNLAKTKENANHSYVALKNKEKNFETTKTIDLSDSDISNAISGMKVGDISRPFEYNGSYAIARLDAINEPKQMSFEQAKTLTSEIYAAKKHKQALEELAKSYNGSYKNIGLINRDTTKSTASGLSETEFVTVANHILNSDKKQSYIMLDDKAVAYKIYEQKLQNPEKLELHKANLSKSMDALKRSMLMQEVLEDLQKRYPISVYYNTTKANK